jgi:hypothetical protein
MELVEVKLSHSESVDLSAQHELEFVFARRIQNIDGKRASQAIHMAFKNGMSKENLAEGLEAMAAHIRENHL